MEIVKIRRVGNSNVISLPKALADAGYVEGESVVLDLLENGQLVMSSVKQHQQKIRAEARAIIDEQRDVLDMLEAYDRGELAGTRPYREDHH